VKDGVEVEPKAVQMKSVRVPEVTYTGGKGGTLEGVGGGGDRYPKAILMFGVAAGVVVFMVARNTSKGESGGGSVWGGEGRGGRASDGGSEVKEGRGGIVRKRGGVEGGVEEVLAV